MNERRRDFWTAIGFVVVCAAGVVAIVYALGCGVFDPQYAEAVRGSLASIERHSGDVAEVTGEAKNAGIIAAILGGGTIIGGGGAVGYRRWRGGTGNGTE